MSFVDQEQDQDLKVNLDPLIDCIFLLIIFFLVTTSFIKMEQDLSINLPIQSREMKVKKPPTRPIIVNVKYLSANNVAYTVETERVSLEALTVNFSRARIRNRDQAVIIRGDRRVRWEHVAAVMSCCARAGIVKVSATMEIRE